MEKLEAESYVAVVFQRIASLSSVRDQPPFSFLVLRNVNKFAGPCETSPGCFDSSLLHCACHPGEWYVVPSFPLDARSAWVGGGHTF